MDPQGDVVVGFIITHICSRCIFHRGNPSEQAGAGSNHRCDTTVLALRNVQQSGQHTPWHFWCYVTAFTLGKI